MREIIQGMGKSRSVPYRCPLGLPWSKGGFPSSCRETDFTTADLLQALSIPQLILAHQSSATAAQGWVKVLLCFAGQEPPAGTAKIHWCFREFEDAFANRPDFFSPEEFSVDKGTVASGPKGVNLCGSTAERLWTWHVPGCCGLYATTSQQMEALGPCGQDSLCQGPLQQKIGC